MDDQRVRGDQKLEKRKDMHAWYQSTLVSGECVMDGRGRDQNLLGAPDRPTLAKKGQGLVDSPDEWGEVQ